MVKPKSKSHPLNQSMLKKNMDKEEDSTSANIKYESIGMGYASLEYASIFVGDVIPRVSSVTLRGVLGRK